jgi:methionyl-tRNA synthetase
VAMDMARELDQLEAGQPINPPEVLFAKITEEQVAEWKSRFGGLRSDLP